MKATPAPKTDAVQSAGNLLAGHQLRIKLIFRVFFIKPLIHNLWQLNLTNMKPFSLSQKWVKDASQGRFFGEVIETSEQGRRGIVIITDDRGNVLDTFCGSAAKFQTAGDWQPIEE